MAIADPAQDTTLDVDLQVLGPLRVLIDGRAVELGPARRRTLLAALCVAPRQVLSVDTLADRIWDGKPPSNPSATVHAYVSRLRGGLRTFGPDGSELPSPLRTHAPGYRLDVPPSAVDEHRFQEGVEEARERHGAGRPAEARRAIRAALALWRGPAYNDVTAEFARLEAHRLADARLSACELAIQVDLDLGRHEALLPEISALLQGEPLRERLHASLMLALYRSGRQADALRHYDIVRRQMDEELGVDPGPDLRRLQEQILRQEPTLEPPRSAAPVLDLVPTAAPDEVATGARIIGRDAEIARLRDVLDRAAAGRTSAVALIGEAGIGKTRLVEEVAPGAAAHGARVAWGRCWPHEGAPILWPWVQALDALLDQVPDQEVEAALAGRGRAVVSLVPRLARSDRGGASEATGPLDVAHVRLYDAVAQVLATLTSDRPAVLVLEDMHWSDQASRELTEYVVAQLSDARLAVVLTVRSPTDDSSRAGSELLTALSRSGRAERIVLGGLSPAAVSDYVATRAGSMLDPTTSEALTDRTGGNPFFVGELVRLLVTDAGGDSTALPDTVPDSIRDVIARRVERLPDDDQTVLRVAAIVGRTFDLDLIEAVCRLDEDAVDEAVDRATERGIICSEPSVAGRHRFVHALTQQTLLDTTGPARVRRLHGRVAAAIEARQVGTDLDASVAESLAFHLSRAGGQDELARAVDLSLDAVDVAVRHGNYPEAESLLLRTLDLTSRLDEPTGGPREMATRLRLWSFYVTTYGPGAPGAVAQHERAMELVRRHGGARDVMRVHQAAYARSIWVDDLPAVDTLIGEMATNAAAAPDDDLLQAGLQLARAQLFVHRGRPVEALAACTAVEALDDELDDPPIGIFPITPAALMRYYQAMAASLLGDEPEAARFLALLVERTGRAGPTTVAYVHANVAFLHALRNEPELAVREADKARELSLRHGFVEALVFVDIVHAWASERLRPGRFLHDLDEALAASAGLATMALRPSMLALTADVRLRAHDTAGALSAIESAFAESAVTTDALALTELHRLRAVALAGTDPVAAAADLDEAERIAREQGAVLLLDRVLATRASH